MCSGANNRFRQGAVVIVRARKADSWHVRPELVTLRRPQLDDFLHYVEGHLERKQTKQPDEGGGEGEGK